VVLTAVAPRATVAGVPARVVRISTEDDGLSRSRGEALDALSADSFAYAI
jgi:serine acetyltransferase